MPSLALSSASDQMLPGASSRETIISSRRARACSESPALGACAAADSARERVVALGALAGGLAAAGLGNSRRVCLVML